MGQEVKLPENQIITGDCLDILKDFPNDCVDLVLTDPPYGIGMANWDDKPMTNEQRDECLRVGLNQMFFGGNYFELPHTESWICWDKTYRYALKLDIGEFEMIWTSFIHKATFIRYTCCGNFRGLNESVRANYNKAPNDHPTEKPLDLMRHIIKQYSLPNDLILDPFCGSGTTCVAAKMLGRRYIGIDISAEYCEIARQRLEAVDTGVPVKEQRKGQMAMFKE